MLVFAFVGGLYFFLRTTLNALVKCLRVIIFLAYKSLVRIISRKKANDEEKLILGINEVDHVNSHQSEEEKKDSDMEEKKPKRFTVPRFSPDPRVSLLASLPADYHSTSFKTSKP